MPDIPECEFKFGDNVVVRSSHKYAEDYPEVFLVAGLDWHLARNRPVPTDQVNITLIPLEDLNDGGADGFTSDDLRHAHEEEVVQNRRLYG